MGWKQTGTSKDTPYYYNVLCVLFEIEDPLVSQQPFWVWIWGDKEAKARILNYLHSYTNGEKYILEFAEYVPALFERPKNHSLNTKKAKTNVQVVIMFVKQMKFTLKNLPKFSEAPHTSEFKTTQKYNKLKYCIYNTELRMEFYLQLLDLFCKQGDAALTVFGRGKRSGTAWVCTLPILFNLSRLERMHIELYFCTEICFQLDSS